MKPSSLLIFIAIFFGIFILQEIVNIQSDREINYQQHQKELFRILDVAKSEYQEQCSGVSLPIKPKVGRSSQNMLNAITNSRNINDREFLIKVLQNKNPDLVKYILSIVPYVVPFILLFVSSLIGFWFYCGCVCCDCYIRCCCRCCRRNPAEKPYTNCEIWWPIIVFLVFGSLTIGMCILGYVSTFDFKTAVDQSGCSVSLLFKDVVYGSNDAQIKWSGTSGVETLLRSVSTDINAFGVSVTNAFGGGSTSFISGAQTALTNSLINVDSGFDITAQINVVSPTTGVADSLEIPFFQNVGPHTESGTLTAQLNSGLDSSIFSATSSISSLESFSNVVQSNVANIQSFLNSAITPINNINKDINKFGRKTLNGIDQVKPLLNYVEIAFIVIFSILIVLIGLTIMGVLLAKICKISCCRILIHFGWCCTSWIMILSLLIGVILFASGFVLKDVCFSLDQIVSRTQLGKIVQIKDISKYIQGCLDTKQNYSIAQSLGIDVYLNQINDVTTSISSYQINAKGGNLSSNDFTTLTSDISNVTNLEANPNILISSASYPTINSTESWETVTESIINTIDDYFVANDNQCSTGGATLGAAYGSGVKRCINVLTFAASTHYTSCPGFSEAPIIRLQSTLTEIVSGLGDIKTRLESITTTFNTEAANVNNFHASTFNTFKNSILEVINDVSDPNTGLIVQLDCNWIGFRWEDFDKALCHSLIPNYILIGIALLLSACWSIFVVWCGGCIVIRLKPSHHKSMDTKNHDEEDLSLKL